MILRTGGSPGGGSSTVGTSPSLTEVHRTNQIKKNLSLRPSLTSRVRSRLTFSVHPTRVHESMEGHVDLPTSCLRDTRSRPPRVQVWVPTSAHYNIDVLAVVVLLFLFHETRFGSLSPTTCGGVGDRGPPADESGPLVLLLVRGQPVIFRSKRGRRRVDEVGGTPTGSVR